MEPIKASFGPMTFELTLDGRELALLTALAAKRGGDASARTTRMELLVRMAVQFGLAHLRPHLEFEEQEQVDDALGPPLVDQVPHACREHAQERQPRGDEQATGNRLEGRPAEDRRDRVSTQQDEKHKGRKPPTVEIDSQHLPASHVPSQTPRHPHGKLILIGRRPRFVLGRGAR